MFTTHVHDPTPPLARALRDEELTALPFIPVYGAPLLPGESMTLHITAQADRAVIQHIQRTGGWMAVVLAHPREEWQRDAPWFDPIITIARHDPFPDGITAPSARPGDLRRQERAMHARCHGVARARMLREYHVGLPYTLLDATRLPPPSARGARVVSRWRARLRGLLSTAGPDAAALTSALGAPATEHPEGLADALIRAFLHDPQERRRLHLMDDPSRRLEEAGELLLERVAQGAMGERGQVS